MGLFSFVKNAGKKLFGSSTATAAPAEEIKKELESHGFDATKLEIKVDGDKVAVKGPAITTEEAEKLILSIGNTQGVAQVDADLVAKAVAPASVMHEVKKGETLWAIAEHHYGKGKGAKYTEIVKANSPPVKDPDLIQPGWVLRIPPLA